VQQDQRVVISIGRIEAGQPDQAGREWDELQQVPSHLNQALLHPVAITLLGQEPLISALLLTES
jgi:hypothetical protein